MKTSSFFRSTTALLTLVAYVSSLAYPALAQAEERAVSEAAAERADEAARVGGGSLSSSGARGSATAVGAGPRALPVDDGEGEQSSGAGGPRDEEDGGAPTETDDGDVSGASGEEGEGEPADETSGDGQTQSLPSGDDKSGVTGQAISVPKGAGSIQGMGESFSAQLSTGIATFSVPFALPKARGGVQPSLGLSYGSGGGTGPVGQGWSVGVPFIARQTDRGLPKYDDRAAWHPEQDTFVFNGGQELVPICTVTGALACAGAIVDDPVTTADEDEVMPSWAAGYQYFRPRVEGSFLRFFWSPDHRTWIVQDKSGTTMELGAPRNAVNDSEALDRNPDRTSEIYRWHLSRQYDVHTSGGQPVNVVVYKYGHAGGRAYLTDIFDTPPTDNAATAQLETYAHHTRLVWEPKPDALGSYRSGWWIEDGARLARVEVASKRFLSGSAGDRRQVRKYHLGYDANLHKSLLVSVQVEGRCGGSEDDATVPVESGAPTRDAVFTSGFAGPRLAASSCERLPPMTFGYSQPSGHQPDGTPEATQLAGFPAFDGRVASLSGSPNHSLDEQLTDFFDIDADALPDVLVTAPGVYGNGHAVFFNGAAGAQGFGAATNMRVQGVLGADANTIKLSNLNLAALDFDGDGRINLLHAPQVKTYSAYDPQRIAGSWWWVGRAITTASGQNQKIDFGKDTRDAQVMDVDFDGLVDVVVSTGTEYQTFFSLGRLPGGDGQFGHGNRTSAATASISNGPVTRCVPHSSLPVRFGDSDVRLGDMNGDGITDIVRVRKGQVIYWPGRGNGVWGTGDRDTCPAGTFGANRHVTMGTAPQYSDVEGTTLKLSDVDGDGLDDLIQINYDSIDIYLNVDGKGWTTRYILDGTPYHAGYHNRVRLVDVNGSGTLDVVWGDAKAYRFIDLQGGQKQFLLTTVENGLGKQTSIEYSTSTEQMRAAEALGSCTSGTLPAGVDPWTRGWCKKMPTVAHVVRRVSERDQITIRGRPPATYVTEYEYRDPVFEGRQREFRGFERARSRRLGDANSPTNLSESVFLLGECRDPVTRTTWDGVDQTHFCAPANRWADNRQEALKGLPVETHEYDLAGVHQASVENVYTIRTLYEGLDGRAVRYAFLSQSDSLLYDTALASSGRVDIARTGFVDAELAPPGAPEPSAPAAYATGMAHVRTRSFVDPFGNQTSAENSGCVGGAACPVNVSGGYEEADETITQTTVPALLAHGSGWLWRTVETYVTGSRDTTRRKWSTTSYDALGRPTKVEAHLLGTLALDRSVTASLPASGLLASDGTFTQGTTAYDAFGNAIRARAANGRCAEVGYDFTGSTNGYGLFATTETVFTADAGSIEAPQTACSGGALTSSAAYDHGFGAVTLATDLNLRQTLAAYDGFGRIRVLHKPSATEVSGATYSDEPSVLIDYRLPGCDGCATNSLSESSKHSIIHTRAQDGANEADTTNYLESYAYVDGFGRTLVTLSEADPTEDDAAWIAGSLLEWDQKSAVSKKYLEFFYDGDPESFDYSAYATTGYGRQRYDAFGRQVQTFDLDGTITLQSRYHALSTDLWDAADLSPGPHQHSYASERKDGHGRTIETTERFRDHGVLELRHVRTLYQSTGEPLVLARVKAGATPVVRWMRYDTLGRMVLNVDAHTSVGFTANHLIADTSSIDAWRYAYNRAGDLVGTSDARGCGQNFFYDGAGRILGEDYAPCAPHHAPYTAAANGVDHDDLEVSYFYDSSTHVPSSIRPAGWAPSFTTGRAVAVADRASASFTTVDGRGRTTRTERRVAKPVTVNSSGVPAYATTVAARYAPRVYSRSFTYDAADREVTATTGTAELRNSNGTPKVPELLSGGSPAVSTVNTSYTRRGTLLTAGSSYGSLIERIRRTADGLVTEVEYGDIAHTRTAYLYDERRRISSVQTYRGPPGSGFAHTPSSSEPTQQLVLQDEDFLYDVVGNPVEIRDWRDPQDWPSGAKPVTKKIQYDDLYRATRIDHVYADGDDEWTSPHAAENAAVETGNANLTDPRRALPSPHVSFEERLLRQTFEYDWVGSSDKTTDDANGFYDRSLGAIVNDGAASKPYQLKSASLPGARGGELEALYDAAGGLTRMHVERNGPCLPVGANCSQAFAYEWDEVGRLARARRWDGTPPSSLATLPSGTPAADLRYSYDASDQRVVKEAVDATGEKVDSVYIFESLELKQARFGTEYGETVGVADFEVSSWTVVPYLLANGVRLARLVYEGSDEVPEVTTGTGTGQVNASTSQLHVFFELGDHLGSTSVVLDKATSELVERSTFQGYGATESDYRPSRWGSFREDYKFTGKEEDIEVGLQYFGKRYLNPLLGRWISADPLAVHVPGQAELNLYSYVSGTILKNVDPLGLDEKAAIRTPIKVGPAADWKEKSAKFAEAVAPLIRTKVAAALGIQESEVTSEAVAALVAQLSSESKNGSSIFNHNIGNKKASAEVDHYYKDTPETFATAGERDKFLQNPRAAAGQGKPFETSDKARPFGVMCTGKTECTRFRSFGSLEEGLQAFVDRVKKGAAAIQDLVSKNDAAGRETTNAEIAHTFKESTKVEYKNEKGEVVSSAYYATASEQELATSIGNSREGTERALQKSPTTDGADSGK